MTNPKEQGTYLVAQRAKGDSEGLPKGLSWYNYRRWRWTGKNWIDEKGTVVTNLTGCESWEKLEA